MSVTTNEWLIAEEICEGLEFLSADGRVEFDTEVELDGYLFVEVVGAVTYESHYEEATNYRYLTYASTEIDTVKVSKYDAGGNAVPVTERVNDRLIAKYITQILMR
jgi:hypothetical protein